VDTEDAGEDMFTEGGHWKPESAPSAWPANAMDHVEKLEFQEIFSMCLDGLAERHRMVFVSKEVEGNESEEVCQEFDITTSNLWVILHRARLQLRSCLNEHWFGVQTEST
jgi:RNA polymerase sigma-70 factor (ECF subfamily)